MRLRSQGVSWCCSACFFDAPIDQEWASPYTAYRKSVKIDASPATLLDHASLENISGVSAEIMGNFESHAALLASTSSLEQNMRFLQLVEVQLISALVFGFKPKT